MKFKKLSIVSLILSILLLSSCTSVPKGPTKAYIQTGPSYEEHMHRVTNIGIISDVCIARDAVGSDDYFSIEDSKLVASSMIEGAKTYLEQKGYIVGYQFSPSVGAFKVTDKTFKVKEQKEKEVSDKHSPFFISESLNNDELYKQAIINVISKVVNSVSQRKGPPSEIFESDKKIHESLEIIAERTKTDIMLFTIGNGAVVPGIKSFTQGMTTGMLTGLATMGTASVIVQNVTYLDSYVALVDLRKGELLWSNSLRLTRCYPLRKRTFLSIWPKNLLYHIPQYGTDPMLSDYGDGYFVNINRDSALMEELGALRTMYSQTSTKVNFYNTPSEQDKKTLVCRGLAPVRTPDGTSFPSYIVERLNSELKLVGIHSMNADVEIKGDLEHISFSSVTGKWTIRMKFSSEGSDPFTVEHEYSFPTSFFGRAACEIVKSAFIPAVQDYAITVTSQPKFRDLVFLERSGSK